MRVANFQPECVCTLHMYQKTEKRTKHIIVKPIRVLLLSKPNTSNFELTRCTQLVET